MDPVHHGGVVDTGQQFVEDIACYDLASADMLGTLAAALRALQRDAPSSV